MKSTIAPLALSRCTFVILPPVGLGVQAAAPAITGELKQWHKVTLTLDGPLAHETDTEPNPFTDYRDDVTFTHESGSPQLRRARLLRRRRQRGRHLRRRPARNGARTSRPTRPASGPTRCRSCKGKTRGA